jgi:hypothetical protein
LELRRSKKRFKPGYPFNFQAIVRKFDGSLETRRITPVELKVTYFITPLLCSSVQKTTNLPRTLEFEKESQLQHGIANFVLHVPENVTTISIAAQYLYAKTSLVAKRILSNSRDYLFTSQLAK